MPCAKDFTGSSVVHGGAADAESEPQWRALIADAGASVASGSFRLLCAGCDHDPNRPGAGPLRAAALRAAPRSEVHARLRPTWRRGDRSPQTMNRIYASRGRVSSRSWRAITSVRAAILYENGQPWCCGFVLDRRDLEARWGGSCPLESPSDLKDQPHTEGDWRTD